MTGEEVLGALRALQEKCQTIVVRSEDEDLSWREIGEAQQIPIGTVMSRLRRGRTLLRVELAEYAAAHGLRRTERA